MPQKPQKPQKPQNCCECYRECKNEEIIKTCRCGRPICTGCYQKHVIRAQNQPWYKQYVGTCDSCIWFDIG